MIMVTKKEKKQFCVYKGLKPIASYSNSFNVTLIHTYVHYLLLSRRSIEKKTDYQYTDCKVSRGGSGGGGGGAGGGRGGAGRIAKL